MKTGTEYRQKIVDEVQKCVCRERYEQYGDAQQNFEDTAEVWTWYLKGKGLLRDDASLTGIDFGQMMSLMKISRTLNNTKYLDSVVDCAGYSVCTAGIMLSEQEEQPDAPAGGVRK